MNRLFPLLTALLFCACSPDRQKIDRANQAQSDADLRKLFASMGPPIAGRFQVVLVTNHVFKFDTATGRTWIYTSIRVPNTNVVGGILADGWEPVPDSFSADAVLKANWNPNTERLPHAPTLGDQ